MSGIDYLDTSAVLNMPSLLEDTLSIVLSRTVIVELEEIKNSSTRDNEIKAAARKASRTLFSRQEAIQTPFYSQKEVEKVWRKFQWLPRNNDGIILAEAAIWSRKNPQFTLVFWTADYNQFIAAKQLGFICKWCGKDKDEVKEPWKGWNNFILTDDKMAALYSNPSFNILDAKVNEYCKIYEKGSDELKDVLRWDGEKYCKLKYKEMRTALGEVIKPRNLEQKMYFDLLQNKNIPIKCCVSSFGTGKSLIALTYALQEVQNGHFNKVVFVKNNLEVKGAGRLGIMPGNELEKQYPWLRQIEDHIGYQRFEEYLETGIIEPAHLTTLRGRDLKNCCVVCDEAENLLVSNIQLLLGRIAENSEIIFCGDIKQCDYSYKEQSGIPHLINRLTGDPLFGNVKLVKTERSQVAATADLLD